MPKKLSEIQIKEIIDSFIKGIKIEELSEKFKCTKNTITRHIKKNFSEKDFKKFLKKNIHKNQFKKDIQTNFSYKSDIKEKILEERTQEEILFSDPSFIEIEPLNYEIDNQIQKDLTSLPLSEISFPKVVYMIVDKKIELEIKLLKDYPDWQFLSQNELSRKTIEIFFDLKIAKKICNKEQKVIKVPNTDVFRIVAPILVSRGISRIISSDKLIAS